MPDSGKYQHVSKSKADILTDTLSASDIWLRWLALLSISGLLIFLFNLIKLPAATLLGPMLASILLSLRAKAVKIPVLPFYFAQAIIGCLIALSVDADFITNIQEHAVLFIVSIVFVLFVSTALGYCLAYFKVLPGSTAIWGSAPGAASVMTILSGHYGADARLVALMQYLRVVMIAATASLAAHFLASDEATNIITETSIPFDWQAFAQTMIFIIAALIVARFIKIPSAGLMLPLFGAIALQFSGYLTISLPPLLLHLAYAVIGWRIGSSFTRDIIIYAAKILPKLILSILALIIICGFYAYGVTLVTDIDLVTAYLANSPGGADAMVIIAASAGGNTAFIMTMQTFRFFVVLLTGSYLARTTSGFLARTKKKKPV